MSARTKNAMLVVALGMMAFLGVAAVALSQEAITVSLSASPTSGSGTVTPTLTWSSNGNSCTASGGWSGSKAPSGSQTVTAITASTTYNLVCTGAGGWANLSWTAPTQNTDGSALTDLAGFKIYYGSSATSMNTVVDIPDKTKTSYRIEPLGPATWYFSMTAYNAAKVESAKSNSVNKVVALPTGTASVTVAVDKVPKPPVLTAVQGSVAYELKLLGNGEIRLGRSIGTVTNDTACGPVMFGADYAVVPLAAVDVTREPKSSVVVAQCQMI